LFWLAIELHGSYIVYEMLIAVFHAWSDSLKAFFFVDVNPDKFSQV
jgi:hypothetical protein